MKRYRHELVIAGLLLVSGCAAYEIGPLSTNHPAHPEAIAASTAHSSKTLAYAASDVPSVRPMQNATATQQDGHESHHAPAPNAPQTAVGDGKIIAVVPNSNQIVLEHGPIEGFMDAMTMGYQIDPPSLARGLQPGDQVRFTIDVPKKTIVKIEKGSK